VTGYLTAIEALEGTNEPSCHGNQVLVDFPVDNTYLNPQGTVLRQQALYNSLYASADQYETLAPISGVSLLSPSTCALFETTTQASTYGGAPFDYVNLHDYPMSAEPQSTNLANNLAVAEAMATSPTPVIVTETGYNTSTVVKTNAQLFVSETAQGKYIPAYFQLMPPIAVIIHQRKYCAPMSGSCLTNLKIRATAPAEIMGLYISTALHQNLHLRHSRTLSRYYRRRELTSLRGHLPSLLRALPPH